MPLNPSVPLPPDGSSGVAVNDNGSSLTVDGSISVSNFPATQPVSGTVTANAGTGPFPVSDNSGSLTVDGTITANAGSGTFTVGDGGSSISVDDNSGSLTVDGSIVPDRPSQKSGRVYKEGQLGAQTTSQTVYTVTAGKTLYVTSISLSGFNSSTSANGLIQIRDNTTVKIPISVPIAGLAALASLIPANIENMVFPEPKQFATNFNINLSTGTITYSVEFTGYEE